MKYNVIIRFLHKINTIIQIHRWQHVAIKATRNVDMLTAEIAISYADELRNTL